MPDRIVHLRTDHAFCDAVNVKNDTAEPSRVTCGACLAEALDYYEDMAAAVRQRVVTLREADGLSLFRETPQ